MSFDLGVLELNREFKEIEVFCDEDADKKLFLKLKKLDPFLKNIHDAKVSVYPNLSKVVKEKTHLKIIPLFEFDRPDYIITLMGNPILVVEITEHAYTGDNGLQRFGRVASAAENHVSFIYFGPLSRVRDDELDLTDDPSTLSKRSLTSDFFLGMNKLNEFYGSYQLFSEWITAENGKVRKVSENSSDEMFLKVFGHLIRLISEIIKINVYDTKQTVFKKSKQFLDDEQIKLKELSKIINTKFSDVRINLTPELTQKLISKPYNSFFEILPIDYFFKGKPDKLIALYAIEQSTLKYLIYQDEIISDPSKIKKIIGNLQENSIFQNGSLFYYTGYKWRSDPHCGVAINLFYRICVSKDTETPLILFYPRISISKKTVDELYEKIKLSDILLNYFKKRYPDNYDAEYSKTTNSENILHHWEGQTKQGRIFSKYCSLIICNDGIIIGKKIKI